MPSRRVLGSAAALVALSAAVFLYAAHPVRGSDHQDSPSVVNRPATDITDVYLFPDPNVSGNVVLVMNVHPLLTHVTAPGASFDPDTLYQFKIVNGPQGTTSPENTVVQITAKGQGSNQVLTLRGPGTPPITGTQSQLLPATGTFSLNQVTNLAGGVVAFGGQRADPFFFDLFQFFTILPDRLYSNPRTYDRLGSSTPTFNGYSPGSTSGPSGSGYACSTNPSVNALTQIGSPPGFNVLALAISMPASKLETQSSSLVHLWATTSRPIGKFKGRIVYQQGELLARPAVKELFEPFNLHEATNLTNPYQDRYIPRAIGYFMRNVAGRSAKISNVVQAVLGLNELAADLSQPGPAAYLGVETGGATGSKYGGRGLTDNIVDISLGAVFGNTVPALGLAPDDGKENNCLTSQHVVSGQGGQQTQGTFPYLAPPH
jgi:Domain of unknown function (DUF4331)